MRHSAGQILIVQNSHIEKCDSVNGNSRGFSCLGKIERYRIRGKQMNPLRKVSSGRTNRRYGLLSHDDTGVKGHRSRPSHTTVFLPGSPIRLTGIYEVIHDKGHRTPMKRSSMGRTFFPAAINAVKKFVSG